MLISFIVQLIAEFFPISSTLFLRTLNLSEGLLFHIFSSILFLIIYAEHILFLISAPIKNIYTICAYLLAIIPSVVVGLLVNQYHYFNFNFSFQTQLVMNISSAVVLYMALARYKLTSLYQHLNFNLKDSLVIGLLTSMNGIFPGISRLGMSLLYLIIKGYDIRKAYDFSLITSIPVLLGKPILSMVTHKEQWKFMMDFTVNNYPIILLSMAIMIFFHSFCKRFISISIVKNFILLRILYFLYVLLQQI